MEKYTRPFKRTVGEKEILEFKYENPETYTKIQLVDEVLIAFYYLDKKYAKEVAEYLELDEKKLSYALEILTGLRITDIAQLVRISKLRATILKYPERPMDEIAQLAGFCDRTSVAHLLKNKKFAHYFADLNLEQLRPKRYYVSKKGEKKHRNGIYY